MVERENHKKERNQRGEIFSGISVPPLPSSEIPIIKPELNTMLPPSGYPWIGVQNTLKQRLNTIGKQFGGITLALQETPPEISTDFGVACHPLEKGLRKSPVEIAQELALKINEQLKTFPFIERVTSVNGYVNFELATNPFGDAVLRQVEELKNHFGEQNIGNGNMVILDCSSPNVAKFMSVGHLRSTVIGESLARIYRAVGYTVIRDNHLGDWGTQFGMLARAYELWGHEIPKLQQGGTNTVKGLYALYVKMHEAIEGEKKQGESQESQLEREGKAWFAKLESGDPQARDLLKWATAQSLAEFQRVYNLLGAKFEYYLGESFYVPMLPTVLGELERRQIATRDEKNLLAIHFDPQDKLSRLVVQTSDGRSLYATRDIAALIARVSWFNPAKILYVVGGEQKSYFQQVFAAFNKLIGEDRPHLEHVRFGMVTLPGGEKMSTRRGKIVFLEEVLEESIRRVKEKIKKGNQRGLTPEEIKTARQVGVGAVIYMDLCQGRERGIQFDLEHALSFEENSGPYIQYAYVRTQSVLRRAQDVFGIKNIEAQREARFDLPLERFLVKQLARFPETVNKALEANQPSVIAGYVYKLAELFNQFYKQEPILHEPDLEKRNTKLRLTSAVGQVIKNGLCLLGIEAPEKM